MPVGTLHACKDVCLYVRLYVSMNVSKACIYDYHITNVFERQRNKS